MPDRYVNPAVGSSGDGQSWAQAYKTLYEATQAAQTGETIYFATGTSDPLGADTTYTLASNVRVISTSDTTNSPPLTYAAGATVSSTFSGLNVIINGTCSWYGVTFSLGTGTNTTDIRINNADAGIQIYEDCTFAHGGTSGTTFTGVGTNVADTDTLTTFVRCNFSWGATTQGFSLQENVVLFIDCNLSSGSTHPAILFEGIGRGSVVEMIGCDVSNSATLFEDSPSAFFRATLRQCKLYGGATPVIFAPTVEGGSEVYLYDCAAGDSHIEMAHYSYLGSTEVTTTYSANDNIGISDLSWKVVGSAYATRATPYYSPWLCQYHDGVAAITPYVEALRVDSTSMYDEKDVWLEVTAKTTPSTPMVSLYSNRPGPLVTASSPNATSIKTYSDWTGSPTATDNADSTLKLALNTPITPVEPGDISARVGVAGNYTLYVDPRIRGLR